jgi:hypothetical protein
MKLSLWRFQICGEPVLGEAWFLEREKRGYPGRTVDWESVIRVFGYIPSLIFFVRNLTSLRFNFFL